jgi:hypothetical protein
VTYIKNLYSKAELIKQSGVLNSLEQLKSILQKEVKDLKINLMKNHSQQGDATNRLLSRLANRNDVIRINTIEGF